MLPPSAPSPPQCRGRFEKPDHQLPHLAGGGPLGALAGQQGAIGCGVVLKDINPAAPHRRPQMGERVPQDVAQIGRTEKLLADVGQRFQNSVPAAQRGFGLFALGDIKHSGKLAHAG